MSRRHAHNAIWGIAGVATVLFTVAVPFQEPPERVSPQLIATGDSVYRRAGCGTCHGEKGLGRADTGSDLTDDSWTFTDGTFQGIIRLISTGVTAEESTHGMPMPPKAAVFLTPNEIEAVSAYVWSLRTERP